MSENTPESKTQNIPDSAADALAANTNTSGRLNGNEAVNMAAEAWKDAAGQNIPAFKFADEPLESDTANLRRSEEHTSELQSRGHLVCPVLLEKKKKSLTTAVTDRGRRSNT